MMIQDPDRALTMYLLHANGMNYAQIARIYDVSPSRVTAFCRKIERITRGFIHDLKWPATPDDSPWVQQHKCMTLLDRIMEGKKLNPTPAEIMVKDLDKLARAFTRSADAIRNQRREFKKQSQRVDDRMELLGEFLQQMVDVVNRNPQEGAGEKD